MAVGIGGPVKGQVVFTGQQAMAARLSKLAKAFPVLWSEALLEEGQNVLKEAQDRYVPIESEDLKNSGEILITPISKGRGAYLVDVQFGNTPETRPYAVAVHEHPSTASPPSWRGVSVIWSKPGTGPKYLQKPLNAARGKMPFRIAAKVESRMPLIPGAFTTTK